MGEWLQGQGAQPPDEEVTSRSFLINVQCIFEAIQCWCLSSSPGSLSLGFPVLASIKPFFCKCKCKNLMFFFLRCEPVTLYLLHMWWEDAPLPLGNVKIVCIYSYLSLFSLISLFVVFMLSIHLLSLSYVPPFIFLCLLKNKILF